MEERSIMSHRLLIDRRRFLQLAVLSTAGTAIPQWSLLAETRPGALRLGIVGLGGRGKLRAEQALRANGLSVRALCDCDAGTLRDMASEFPNAALFEESGALLARSELYDALVIAVPEPMELSLSEAASKNGFRSISTPRAHSCHGSHLLATASCKCTLPVVVTCPSARFWHSSAYEAMRQHTFGSPFPRGFGLDRRLSSALDAALRAMPAANRWVSMRIAPFFHQHGCDYEICIRGTKAGCSLVINIMASRSNAELNIRDRGHEYHVDLSEPENTTSSSNLWRNSHSAIVHRKRSLLAASPQTLGLTAYVLALMAESRTRGEIDCGKNLQGSVQHVHLAAGDHVPLCESLNFRFGHRREVCVFSSDDPSRNIGMMGL